MSRFATRQLTARLATGFMAVAIGACSLAPDSAFGADDAAATVSEHTDAGAQDLPAPAVDRQVPVKPKHTTLHPGASRNAINVKFAEGSAVRVRGNKLVSVAPGSLPKGTRAKRAAAGTVETQQLNDVLRSFGAKLDRMHTKDEQSVDAAVAQAAADDPSRVVADLNLWASVTLKKGTDPEAVIDALNALDIVEVAEGAPVASPQPVSPDYRVRQGYRGPANAVASGIDALYAWTVPGGTGANVRVLDIEYNWNATHEDLTKLKTALVPNGTPKFTYDSHHGTAVSGQIVGDNNTFGVTGLVPNASYFVTNADTMAGYNIAGAITTAAAALRPGDVMLLEQQLSGPGGACGADQVGCIPVEYYASVFDAIANATARGIIVVEAAGNGRQDLDSAIYRGAFNRSVRDSGAIIVGAGGSGLSGCSAARTRLNYSNHGSRVDVQGWGECVTTTGYGDLYKGVGINQYYTSTFAGTSSASPIVTSAAAALSSIAKQRGYTLTPAQVRTILRNTGTAQTAGLAGNIGPLPNLRAAIASLGTGGGSDTTAPTMGKVTQAITPGGLLGATATATTTPVTVRWSATDAGGIGAYSVIIRANGGSWVQQTLPTATTTSMTWTLTAGNRYDIAVAAQDRAGNWSAWAYSANFGVAVFQEDSQYVTRAGTWTRAAYAPASGGYVSVASARSATTTFTFTGTHVAWIGTKATTRGTASVWIDGVFKGTVDLYAAATAPRTVVSSWSWTSPGTHKIQVVVDGTANRPKVDVDAFAILG